MIYPLMLVDTDFLQTKCRLLSDGTFEYQQERSTTTGFVIDQIIVDSD